MLGYFPKKVVLFFNSTILVTHIGSLCWVIFQKHSFIFIFLTQPLNYTYWATMMGYFSKTYCYL